MGATVLTRAVSASDGTPTHDPLLLAAAYRDLFAAAVRQPS
jgi:hypothetical protein